MPAKKKGGRGKTLNIVDFNVDYIPEDNLDWAVVVPQEKTQEQVLEEKLAKRDYSRTANNVLVESGGFREAPSEQVTRRRGIEDLEPPYVAHFGNLRNGTTEEEFLRNFHEDVVVTSRLINQDGKSFAFVEFKTPQALLIALAMDQSLVKGRKLYVDLATPKQVERLRGHSGGLSRQNAGQPQQNPALQNVNLTRDAFGSTQPNEREKDLGSRSGFGSRNDLHVLSDLSRDTLGTATRPNEGLLSPVGPPDFSSWRTEAPTAQPEFQPTLRENRRSETDLDRRRGRGGGGGGGVKGQSFGSLANWRDEPMVQAPPMVTAAAGEGNAPPEEGGAGRRNRGPPRSSAAPAEPCKWEELRR
ncbi:RNA-binding protein [Trypanosoma equiperdum]|uniref:RRM domain-containing protein n=4 Tax=Trypanozoon TaxID=39700 RepID=Q57WY6_TRYB2|nr:hypothetical protein, conserved [Trypanosoma brucei gambiense DAL972]XP_843699.1 hypothetical protein, conserved [Trypanosoma brucei brucei TREU927]AAX69882.1 hypothetical protein, conserved [Trypanosoma brucei]RHW73385.1 RNA-binding protein [Trypanosoma brucei equiperdum]SCU69952.1 RNA-binding protein [Trypanosoma equiperdum]AAZ10140.1 hypothetical protein, conserved [Trypanosoma brucei brucei TREU927]CBH09734.1 hypothetical protein, conserved [Trypanosoma brucei gambiense DAL972]|eukprot:XP_011772027.1 hypothetical protein, conserved [Trypanosoma brucei gambiense DAL972]